MSKYLIKNTALIIPWQGILEEDTGEENCVKDREAPGHHVDHHHHHHHHVDLDEDEVHLNDDEVHDEGRN